jgi:FAD/FMN-containing dehydrogenase
MTTNAATLEKTFAGRVHRLGDDGYDEARLPWQRKFDPHPALVADATVPEDVQAAVRCAREHDLALAVQATGHGAVRAADGDLLLRTGAMDAVVVDPERGTARVGAGALWSDVIAAAAPYGLAPLSGSSAGVGVTGYTLGGGAGWLSRACGFAADSLLRAEVVTADAELMAASADEHPDLFWALRGGGGNFGVATELEFRLHPVERVYAGMAMFEPDRAADTLARYREWALGEPDESNTALVVMTLPDMPQLPEALRGRRVLILRALYIGEAEAAERLLAPLREVAGPPLMDGLRAMAFADTATLLGPPPPPMVGEMHIDLLHDVPDAVIDAVAGADGAAVELRHWGGAMARPGEDAGPIGHRDVPFSVVVSAQAASREQQPAAAAAVERVAARLRHHATGGSFLNFLGDPARTATAYSAGDYQRLAAIKRDYDPANVFGHNHNIPPAA